MILFTILLIALLIITIGAMLTIGIGGIACLLVFGDGIICCGLIFLIIEHIAKKKK